MRFSKAEASDTLHGLVLSAKQFINLETVGSL